MTFLIFSCKSPINFIASSSSSSIYPSLSPIVSTINTPDSDHFYPPIIIWSGAYPLMLPSSNLSEFPTHLVTRSNCLKLLGYLNFLLKPSWPSRDPTSIAPFDTLPLLHRCSCLSPTAENSPTSRGCRPPPSS